MKRCGQFLVALVGLVGAAGCGGGYSKVGGTVKYEDGRPVPGATVVFVPVERGGMSPTGYTDANGRFTLKTGDEEGAPRGKYKVLVTRPARASGGPMEAGSAEAIKAMKKHMPKPGPPGKKSPGAVGSELEARYASADATPLSAELPAPGGLTFTVKAKGGARK